MYEQYDCVGIVEKSETKRRGLGRTSDGLLTILTIVPEKKPAQLGQIDPEKPEVWIPGRHYIKVGERIGLVPSKSDNAYWVESYDILDGKGKVLHSDVAGN